MSEVSVMPKGWVTAPLGDLGQYINGRGFGKAEWSKAGRPIIRIQDLTGTGGEPNYFDGQVEDKYLVRPGDLLVSWAATLGAFLWKGPEGWLNQHIFRVESHIDKSFHYYLIQAILDDLKRKMHGGGIVHITKGKFDDTSVLLPPIGEQRRLVSKIEELFSDLDASVAALERARANLKRYRAAVLKAAVEGQFTAHWRKTHSAAKPASQLLERILAERRRKWEEAQLAKFVAAGKAPPKSWKEKYPEPASPNTANLPELPEGWCWTNLDQLKSWAMYGPRFSSEEYVEDGCLVLRTTDFSDTGTINLQTPPKLRLSDKEFERYKAEVGDLLITRTGSLGTLAVFQGGAKAIAGAFLIHYRLAVPMATVWYIFYFLKSPKGNRALTEGGAGVGRPNLNMPKIEAIPIPFPPQAEQERICAEIEERLTLTNSMAEALKRDFGLSSRLRQSILKRAFEGKLVPQDPNDESASVLLERIRAERALSGAGGARKSRKQTSRKGGGDGKKA